VDLIKEEKLGRTRGRSLISCWLCFEAASRVGMEERGFRDMAWVWGAEQPSAFRQWLEPDKLLGSRCGSEERQGAQPESRSSRQLLAGPAERCRLPACHPGGQGQHGILETDRKSRGADPMLLGLSRRNQCKTGAVYSQFFVFLQNLQDECQQLAPGDPAAGEHVSDLCAADLQGKIQQFEAANKVFLHEQ